MNRAVAWVTGLAFALSIIAGPLSIRTAQASEVWCWEDPILEIGGEQVSINIGIRQSDLAATTGATIVVTVPEGIPARVLYIEPGPFVPVIRFVTASSYGNTPASARPGNATATAAQPAAQSALKPLGQAGATAGPTPSAVGAFDITVSVELHGTRSFDYQFEVVHRVGRTATPYHVAAMSNRAQMLRLTLGN